MTQDMALLNFIYQNAEMGKETIPKLTKIVEDVNFRRVLEDQLTEYQEIFNKAEEKIQKEGGDAKGISTMERVSASTMLNLNTLLDKSNTHIAEMMLQGSNMGIIDITKKLKECPDAEPETTRLAQRLLKMEERNLEQLKEFLRWRRSWSSPWRR